MSKTPQTSITAVGIDIGKNSFHIVGQDDRGAIVLRQKWSRGQVEARFANIPPCLIGMEACVEAHHLSRKLKALGHDARLMPAKYVRPYSKGQKNGSTKPRPVAKSSKIHDAERSLHDAGHHSADRHPQRQQPSHHSGGRHTYRIVKRIQGLKLADLRYMHSYMKDLERTKGTEAAAKWFWWSTDPKKHEPTNQ
jgi:hypothetical protein